MNVVLCLVALATAQAAAAPAPWLKVQLRAPGATQVPQDALFVGAKRRQALLQQGHGYVDLLRQQDIESTARGTIRTVRTHTRHFLTQQGVETGGNLSFVINPPLESATLREAWVQRPDGTRVPFDVVTLQISHADDRLLFSDQRRMTLPFASVVPEATAVVVLETEERPSQFPLPWSRHIYVANFDATEYFALNVRFDPKRPLRVRSSDTDLACTTEANGFACHRGMIAPIPLDPDVASLGRLLPEVVVAEPHDWATLAQRERTLLDSQADATHPGVVALARKLAQGAEGNRERFVRLARFVADEVRYVGFEHGEGAVVPRRASVTLQRGFGDCKDKTTLLLALARSVGLEASGALVATDIFDVKKLFTPSWRHFDHMITCARLPELVCFDATVPGLPVGETPLGTRGSVAMLLSAEAGAFNLAAEGAAWNIEVFSNVKGTCAGELEHTVERTFRGAGAVALRANLRAQTQTERERSLNESFARVMGDRSMPEWAISGLEDPAAPVVLRATYANDKQKGVTNSVFIRERDVWLDDYLAKFATANQHHPFRHEGLDLRTRTNYRLCEHQRARFTGPRLNLRSKFGSLFRSYQLQRDEVVVYTAVQLPPMTIAPDDLEGYRKFLTTLESQSTIWFKRASQ